MPIVSVKRKTTERQLPNAIYRWSPYIRETGMLARCSQPTDVTDRHHAPPSQVPACKHKYTEIDRTQGSNTVTLNYECTIIKSYLCLTSTWMYWSDLFPLLRVGRQVLSSSYSQPFECVLSLSLLGLNIILVRFDTSKQNKPVLQLIILNNAITWFWAG